ncbi:uncharacterized protein BJ171DRAFT_474920 [Polychytrium aggregatum]|uniref:uncharacterized protein n=1 Tax=Polychytrium aggregatum TaxID=110093 RepID=UPI0022FEB94E|nr:uncharacterized protein BJ171DRAFT_474920 [Polychytrium aggregatum]KAI9204705.1 hypothetical protein BJ171DRAFT_474920 [Polychytrium aggregatum]
MDKDWIAYSECVWQCRSNNESSHQTIGSSQAFSVNMASMNEPASTTASTTHQSQTEARTTSSMPNITQHSLDHNPDIFTIICCNDSFQIALDHSTIATLLRVCKRVRPLLSSKVPRFHSWWRNVGLWRPNGSLRFALTPSEQIALSLHCEYEGIADRSWLDNQADQGNATALFFLAWIHQIDLDSQQSVNKPKREAICQQIIFYLEKAAQADHPMAQYDLAGCYRNGLGVDQDPTKAVDMFRSLAECGIPQAQVALGGCYENGEGVDQDYDTAIEWYSKAADQGSEDGRLHIVFLRGWFSFIGHGVEQSDADAFNRWHEVSTNSTNPVLKPIATHMVGWMHYLGRGTVQDKPKGVNIIRENRSDEFPLGESESLAANWADINSDSPALRKFLGMCQFGSDHEWLCKHLVAVCLIHGFGTRQDQEKAAGIFEQLANEGHSVSQLWIGRCYSFGKGVSKNDEKAFEWWSKSANQGNSYGQWMVGCCYYSEYGVTRDHTEATEWFRKSAELGNRYGQNMLGDCYKNGCGVTKDIDTAVFWLRKAAEQGFENAIYKLRQLDQWL